MPRRSLHIVVMQSRQLPRVDLPHTDNHLVPEEIGRIPLATRREDPLDGGKHALRRSFMGWQDQQDQRRLSGVLPRSAASCHLAYQKRQWR
jgi:hypothetical protein